MIKPILKSIVKHLQNWGSQPLATYIKLYNMFDIHKCICRHMHVYTISIVK